MHQDRCGIAVGIDAIALAALASWHTFGSPQVRLQVRSQSVGSAVTTRVLDVGCGCGIVALLLRQAAAERKLAVTVLGLELDGNAARQARQNIDASPWDDLRVAHTS
eukprot:SAG11_NODE_9134_length_939_cov_4.263095_1_plen_106_part_10